MRNAKLFWKIKNWLGLYVLTEIECTYEIGYGYVEILEAHDMNFNDIPDSKIYDVPLLLTKIEEIENERAYDRF